MDIRRQHVLSLNHTTARGQHRGFRVPPRLFLPPVTKDWGLSSRENFFGENVSFGNVWVRSADCVSPRRSPVGKRSSRSRRLGGVGEEETLHTNGASAPEGSLSGAVLELAHNI